MLTLTLRDDVVFTDGTPFNADAVTEPDGDVSLGAWDVRIFSTDIG